MPHAFEVAVVVQVVEQCLSMRAGCIQIPDWTLAFFGSDSFSILAGRWAFDNNGVILSSIHLSCLLSSANLSIVTIYQEGKMKSKKRPIKAHIKKCMHYAESYQLPRLGLRTAFAGKLAVRNMSTGKMLRRRWKRCLVRQIGWFELSVTRAFNVSKQISLSKLKWVTKTIGGSEQLVFRELSSEKTWIGYFIRYLANR